MPKRLLAVQMVVRHTMEKGVLLQTIKTKKFRVSFDAFCSDLQMKVCILTLFSRIAPNDHFFESVKY